MKPSRQDTERLAYAIWEAREEFGVPTQPIDNWLLAEESFAYLGIFGYTPQMVIDSLEDYMQEERTRS